MRHAANTHAVDLNAGRVLCGYPHVDVVHSDSRYLTCSRCWRALRRLGVDVADHLTNRRWPRVYLVTGRRVVQDGKVMR